MSAEWETKHGPTKHYIYTKYKKVAGKTKKKGFNLKIGRKVIGAKCMLNKFPSSQNQYFKAQLIRFNVIYTVCNGRSIQNELITLM